MLTLPTMYLLFEYIKAPSPTEPHTMFSIVSANDTEECHRT